MGDTVYIHYGHDYYRKPDPIRNLNYWVKPRGGLWASRKDDQFGWKGWCESEEFRLDRLDECFEFTLKDGTRVLDISKVEQLYDLPKVRPFIGRLDNRNYDTCYLDFEALTKDYDAIEVAIDHNLYWALYGWDCNSILIMNPNCIDIKEEYLQ